MPTVIAFPSRSHLGLSAECSSVVVQACASSYQQGYNAQLRGLFRRRPSCKSDCFDRESWLKGWDDAARYELIAGFGTSPHGLSAGLRLANQ